MNPPPRPWMDEELQALADTATRFFETECVPQEARWAAQHHADRDIWRRAGAVGLLCASIPEAYGGAGGSFAHEFVIAAAQSRALAGQFSLSVHSGIVAHYLLAYGSEAHKRRWLPEMASGARVGALAMTEPGTGSDLQAIKTRAVREGDHYRIRGSKTYITNGHHAGLLCLACKTGTDAGARGISLLLVDLAGDLPGFRRGSPLEKIGQAGQDTVELFFDDVRVPAANLLGGEEGQGFVQMMQQLPRERLLIAVGAAATMQRAVDETLAYVAGREAFGAPLLGLQNTRFKLAECATLARVAQSFVDDCIKQAIAGTLDVATAAMAKWWTTDTLCRIADECLQLHGGAGYMREYPIARIYADSRGGRIYGGSNEVMKEVVARDMERAAGVSGRPRKVAAPAGAPSDGRPGSAAP